MADQKTDGITIVQGKPTAAEAKAFAELADMAAGGKFALLLGPAAATVLQRMYLQPDNEMSFQHTWFATVDGAIAGMCNAYSAAQKQGVSGRTNRLMVQYAGWRAAQLIWVGTRLRHLFVFEQQVPDDTFYIQLLATYPRFRGQGIGQQLLAHAAAQAAAHDCHTLALDVDINNPNAKRVYEYTGFTVAARSPVKTVYGRPQGVERMVRPLDLA